MIRMMRAASNLLNLVLGDGTLLTISSVRAHKFHLRFQ
jgi:hypothetical protein